MKIGDYARTDDGRIFKITKLDLDLCNNNCKINCKKSKKEKSNLPLISLLKSLHSIIPFSRPMPIKR